MDFKEAYDKMWITILEEADDIAVHEPIGVWIPTLERAGVEIRDMKQTRNSFATYHLSRGKIHCRLPG